MSPTCRRHVTNVTEIWEDTQNRASEQKMTRPVPCRPQSASRIFDLPSPRNKPVSCNLKWPLNHSKTALEGCASDSGLFSFQNLTTGSKNDDANRFLRLKHGPKKVPKGNTSTKWRRRIMTWREYRQMLRFENFMCRRHVLYMSATCLQHVLSCVFFFTPKDISQNDISN